MRNMEDLVTDPLGDGGLVPGMSKDKVVDMYGDPDMKRDVTSAEWKEPREEWFYAARYGVIPVNAGYLSDDLYLYFDGRNLTNISKRPMGKGLTDIQGVGGDRAPVDRTEKN
jgi:hypothetical protein